MPHRVPFPVIALINGACFGGGVQLALAADIRVAAEESWFGIPAARIGFIYAPEAVAKLVGLLGPGQVSRLLLTGHTFDAAEAMRLRLVEEVVPSASLTTRGAHMGQVIAAIPEPALKAYVAMVKAAVPSLNLRAMQDLQEKVQSVSYLTERLQALERSRAHPT